MAPPEDPNLPFLGPVVPEGANPYSTFDAFFEGIVWPHPSPGYKARIALLGSLTSYMAIVSISLLVVMAVFQRDRFWVVRLVKREGAHYIVGNSHTLVPIFAICLAPPLLGNLATDAYTYLHHGEQSSSDSWSVSLFPILFAGSWLWSCSGLQAFLLAGGDRRLPVGPRVANLAFLGGLVAGVAAMTALAAVGSHISVEKSEAFFRLDGFIHPHWAAYDESGGLVKASDLKELYSLAQEYDDTVDSYQSLFIKLLYVFAATPFCIGFINLGTLALFLLVRRQVTDNRNTFRPFGFMSTITHHDRTERSQVPPSQTRSTVSRTDDEFVRRLQQLEEVQDELLLTCLAHYLFILALFISTIWIATQFQNQGLTGWSRMEAISLLPGWICSIFFSTFITVRLYRTIRGVCARRKEEPSPSPPRLQLQLSRRTEGPSEKGGERLENIV